MTDLQRSSPLVSAPFIVEQFELRELPHVTKIRVQALRDRGVYTPCADPERFPVEPNTSLGLDPAVLWRAPNDWLAYSQTLDVDRLSRSLLAATADVPLIAAPLITTDVSSASIVLELRGSRAPDVLLRDCTLDLEGGAIEPMSCAQTQLAQVSVLIHRTPDAWRIFVERSVAAHLWDWLTDSAC